MNDDFREGFRMGARAEWNRLRALIFSASSLVGLSHFLKDKKPLTPEEYLAGASKRALSPSWDRPGDDDG